VECRPTLSLLHVVHQLLIYGSSLYGYLRTLSCKRPSGPSNDLRTSLHHDPAPSATYGSWALHGLKALVAVMTGLLEWTTTRGSTPPNPIPDLPIRSTDSHKILRIVGVPNGHCIATIWSTKTCRIKRNRRISTKNHKGFMHTSPTKSQRERSQNRHQKIAKKELRKSPKWENGIGAIKPWGTTPNHLYIPWRFIQGLACLSTIHPSLKISPCSQASPRNSKRKNKRKIAKQNELGFQEMAAILSPLGL
jgi:hypothetical protein